MRKLVYITIILTAAISFAHAQKIEKPILTPKPPTEEQSAILRQGIELHDQKNFDEAIEKYKQILAENPDYSSAIYELALSYYTKGDKTNAIETAVRGSKYRSDELPLFYGIIANVIDDVGKPDEAIRIYRDAIKIVKDDKEFQHYLSSLYYNVGVTYTKQKKYVEAREDLKKAIEYNYKYASPHYLLSEVYSSSKYKVPAMLAAARFVALEYNTQRAVRSSTIFVSGLSAAKKDEKTGSINIFLDLNAPKDEGDFGIYELLLGTLTTVKEDKDKNKSSGEIFVEAVDSFISLLSEDKKLKSTFVGKYYIPYLVSMRKNGHMTAFSYLVLRQAGESTEAERWTQLNGERVLALVNWAKAYELASK